MTSPTLNNAIKIKEIPLWSIFVAALLVAVAWGKLNADQAHMQTRQERIEAQHNQDMRSINAAIKAMERIENQALAQMGVISTELKHISAAVEKLDKRIPK